MTDPKWETHAQEQGTSVILDTITENFTGYFQGFEHVIPEDSSKDEFDLLTFTGYPDDGEVYSLAPNAQLTKAFETIEKDTLCRITLKGLVDTGKASPMKNYRVDVAS